MQDLLKEPIPFFVYAFTSIFIIVNPVSGILTFISLTGEMSKQERKKTARRSVTIACVLGLFLEAIAVDFIADRIWNIYKAYVS